MARADLLLSIVKAARRGDQALLERTIEALIAEERAKHHHVLADRLEESLRSNGTMVAGQRAVSAPGASGDLVIEIEPRRALATLVLPELVSQVVNELIEEQQRADLLRAYNLEPRHRVLLTGPPGNGKTSLAEALAEALMSPLLVVRYDAVVGSFLGETATRLRKMLESVRTRRCVLFFDEFDAIGKERGDVHETGEIKRVVSSLLLQLDALPSYVVIVAASNHPELLDRAVWRRFQVRLNLPAPTPAQIEAWVSSLQRRLETPLGVSGRTVATALSGASFAELEQWSLDVQRQWIMHGADTPLSEIAKARLKQWRARLKVKGRA